jgi:hypothetical protein
MTQYAMTKYALSDGATVTNGSAFLGNRPALYFTDANTAAEARR